MSAGTTNVERVAIEVSAIEHHAQELFNVAALLDAAADRIEEATPNLSADAAGSERMHNTLRLVQMASDRVKAAAEALCEVTG